MKNEFQEWYEIIDTNIIPVKQLFDQYDSGDGVVLDVGGNVGAFTDYVLQKNSKREVHLFEPVRKFHNYLTTKYTNTTVTFVSKGVGEREELLRITPDSINLGWNEISPTGTENIVMTTLDDYIETSVKDSISFIKIDVEFWEPFVLAGMKNYIQTSNRLPIIVIEHNYVYSPHKYKQDEVFAWLFDYYTSFDYKAYDYTKDVVLVPKQYK